MKNIYLHIPDLRSGPLPLALATVIETQGSTPQKPGSSALFDIKGLIRGTIGGGVLEGRVQKIAKEAAGTGKSSICHFELNNDISFREEAICGGQATVLIESALFDQRAFFDQVKSLLRKKIPCVAAVIISGTNETDLKIQRFVVTSDLNNNLPKKYAKEIQREAKRLLESKAGDDFCKIDLGRPDGDDSVIAFLQPLFPRSELVIAGAGHIGKALCQLGSMLDFEVTVIDDRIEFANFDNLPNADHIKVENIGDAIRTINKTSDTFIVIVTRGHNDDANALKQCIGSGAIYIGMIGSRTKIEKMHRDFIENGWADEKQWSEIHAPIGLDILSESVEEIAISIAAELVLERNSKSKAGRTVPGKAKAIQEK
jgi:xanthine dehydrogenase accessory factor